GRIYFCDDAVPVAGGGRWREERPGRGAAGWTRLAGLIVGGSFMTTPLSIISTQSLPLAASPRGSNTCIPVLGDWPIVVSDPVRGSYQPQLAARPAIFVRSIVTGRPSGI